MATLAVVAGCRNESPEQKATPPARSTQLANGGIYPVVVPLGWHLINANGQPEDIPRPSNSPHHRILATGALIASDSAPAGAAQSMMFRSLHTPAPVTKELLDRFAGSLQKSLSSTSPNATLTEKRLFTYGPRAEQAAKVVVSDSSFTQIHYVLPDAKRETWQLTYNIRTSELVQWQPRLAEIESP